MTFNDFIVIAKQQYGLKKLIWVDNNKFKYDANCEYQTGLVRMNARKIYRESDKIMSLFHELGHIHCYKNGIWKNYHYKGRITASEAQDKLVVLTGLKAEKWVDKWAEKEMKKYFPDLQYIHWYQNPIVIKRYKTEFLTQYKWN